MSLLQFTLDFNRALTHWVKIKSDIWMHVNARMRTEIDLNKFEIDPKTEIRSKLDKSYSGNGPLVFTQHRKAPRNCFQIVPVLHWSFSISMRTSGCNITKFHFAQFKSRAAPNRKRQRNPISQFWEANSKFDFPLRNHRQLLTIISYCILEQSCQFYD